MMTLVAMALGGGGAQLSGTGPGKWREDGRRAPRRQRARTQQKERGEDSPQLTRRPARRRPPVNNEHEIKDSSISHTPRPPVFAPLGSRVRTAVLLLPPLSLSLPTPLHVASSMPPDGCSVVPLMKEPSSPASRTYDGAISHGCAKRPTGG